MLRSGQARQPTPAAAASASEKQKARCFGSALSKKMNGRRFLISHLYTLIYRNKTFLQSVYHKTFIQLSASLYRRMQISHVF